MKNRNRKTMLGILALVVLVLVAFLVINTRSRKRSEDKDAEVITKDVAMPTETDRNDATYDEEKADAKDTDGALQKAEQDADSIDPVSEWTTDTVNLRADATTDAEVLAKLSRRKEVQKIGEKGDWTKVTVDDKTGFVKSEYLTAEEPKKGSGVVVIDPGHQGSGNSATEPLGPGSGTMKAKVAGGTRGTTTGVPEYQLTMDIGLKLRTELENRGYTVYLTRESNDVNISNAERAQYATRMGADIYLRLHADGAASSGASGVSVLCPSASNAWVGGLAGQSQTLSQDVLSEYVAATGMSNRGISIRDDMTGFNWATVPIILIEMGFMTNPSDDTNMQDPAFQDRMVQGMANGIDDYFSGAN